MAEQFLTLISTTCIYNTGGGSNEKWKGLLGYIIFGMIKMTCGWLLIAVLE